MFLQSIILGTTTTTTAAAAAAGSSGSSEPWLIRVNSEGLAYTVISLFLSLVLLYVLLLSSRFVLSRTLGVACLIIYVIFVTISILFELNVFFVVNQPTCPSQF